MWHKMATYTIQGLADFFQIMLQRNRQVNDIINFINLTSASPHCRWCRPAGLHALTADASEAGIIRYFGKNTKIYVHEETGDIQKNQPNRGTRRGCSFPPRPVSKSRAFSGSFRPAPRRCRRQAPQRPGKPQNPRKPAKTLVFGNFTLTRPAPLSCREPASI